MYFSRSVPVRKFADFRRYRRLLRHDFLFRCAYCLRHELFLGGESGCTIDHHRPHAGPNRRPDLASVYDNLYWCCRECNENKGVTWPSAAEFAAGWRFLDPCQPADDHDLHMQVHPNGNLEPTTNCVKYTSDRLKLWRDQLVYYRVEIIRCSQEASRIRTLLESVAVPDDYRLLLEGLLREMDPWLNPPVFSRPR